MMFYGGVFAILALMLWPIWYLRKTSLFRFACCITLLVYAVGVAMYLHLGRYKDWTTRAFMVAHQDEMHEVKTQLQNDPSSVIDQLSAHLKENPSDLKGVRLLIKLLLGNHQPERAKKWAKQLPKPWKVEDALLIIQIETPLSDGKEKQQCFASIEKHYPNHPLVLWHLSQDALYWHHNDKALHYLQQLSTELPSDSAALKKVQALIDVL